VNAHNDIAVLDEIHGLMREIRDAWEGVPSLVPASTRSTGLMN
jgi:flagellin-specific chaperone FliS